MAANVNFYAAWQPVRIDAGLSSTDAIEEGLTGGFFINATGLQWNETSGYSLGWLGTSLSLLILAFITH